MSVIAGVDQANELFDLREKVKQYEAKFVLMDMALEKGGKQDAELRELARKLFANEWAAVLKAPEQLEQYVLLEGEEQDGDYGYGYEYPKVRGVFATLAAAMAELNRLARPKSGRGSRGGDGRPEREDFHVEVWSGKYKVCEYDSEGTKAIAITPFTPPVPPQPPEPQQLMVRIVDVDIIRSQNTGHLNLKLELRASRTIESVAATYYFWAPLPSASMDDTLRKRIAGQLKLTVYDQLGIVWPKEGKCFDPRIFVGREVAARIVWVPAPNQMGLGATDGMWQVERVAQTLDGLQVAARPTFSTVEEALADEQR